MTTECSNTTLSQTLHYYLMIFCDHHMTTEWIGEDIGQVSKNDWWIGDHHMTTECSNTTL